jgi:hypothetical protein
LGARFWGLSQLIVDFNGRGPLTERQLQEGVEGLEPADREVLPDRLHTISYKPSQGPDLDLSMVCSVKVDELDNGCGRINENVEKIDLTGRFLRDTGRRGSPRIVTH